MADFDSFRPSYFVMTDDWFSEFVYQIVADRKYISKELTGVFDHGKATVLPPWVSLPRALCRALSLTGRSRPV